MKLTDIAQRIDAHLKRFEADPTINEDINGHGLFRYYNASARQAGRYVAVTYISYQHTANINFDAALIYLSWLEAGNVGRHYEALDEWENSERKVERG